MAWLMPFSLAIWNWLFTAAKSATSYLTRPVSRPSLVMRPSMRLPRLVTRLAPNSYVPIGIFTTCCLAQKTSRGQRFGTNLGCCRLTRCVSMPLVVLLLPCN